MACATRSFLVLPAEESRRSPSTRRCKRQKRAARRSLLRHGPDEAALPLPDLPRTIGALRRRLPLGAQFLDSPIIPDAVADFLRNPDCRCILDVGGNLAGARPLGQLAALREADAAAFLRDQRLPPIFRRTEHPGGHGTHRRLARIPAPRVVSNPNLGRETTLDDVLKGHRRLLPLLERLDAPFDRLCVRLPLLESVRPLVDCPVSGIALHLDGREVKQR